MWHDAEIIPEVKGQSQTESLSLIVKYKYVRWFSVENVFSITSRNTGRWSYTLLVPFWVIWTYVQQPAHLSMDVTLLNSWVTTVPPLEQDTSKLAARRNPRSWIIICCPPWLLPASEPHEQSPPCPRSKIRP